MEQTNQEFRQTPPKRKKKFILFWIILGVVVCAALAAGIWLELYVSKPKVHNAQEAAAYLAEKAEDLGYANALSELTEVYSQNVDGDSYYRLQQNYHGVPVYGRTVVYSADEDGNQLSITQNVQDIPEGLKLTPTVTKEQVLASLTSHFGEEVTEVSLCDGDLLIYAGANDTALSYRFRFDSVEVLVDAHSGDILSARQTMRSDTGWAILAGSSQTFHALTEEDGTFVMKDTDENIYVYDTGGKTFWAIGYYEFLVNTYKQLLHKNLILVKSPDRIFGDATDNIPNSYTATEALAILRNIRGFWRDAMHAPELPYDMVLVVNDNLGAHDTNNAAGGLAFVPGWDPGLLPETRAWNQGNKVALITLGKAKSSILQDNIDTIGHEYSHVMTYTYVDWMGSSSYENGALNEAFSDIFGELTECYLDESMIPDWQHGTFRNIADPQSEGYPAHVTHSNSSGEDSAHGYSTVISHAAYLMWSEDPAKDKTKLSTMELAELWYRAMLKMPADANFGTCRNVVEKAAQDMGLTKDQIDGIRNAFSQAGIVNPAELVNADYQVDQVFTLMIRNPDQTNVQNWSAVIRDHNVASGGLNIDRSPVIINAVDGEDIHVKLDPGYYQVTMHIQGENPEVEVFTIHVTNTQDAARQIVIITGSASVPLPLIPEQPAVFETQPAPTEAPVEDTSGEGYRIQRWDRSYRTDDGEYGMNYYFDYVILEGDSEAVRKINEAIYADAEKYMTFYDPNGDIIYDIANNPILADYTAESEVTYFKNGLLSIKVHTYSDMGGNTDHIDSYSLFFNTNTGGEATLVDLTGIDEQTLLPLLQEIAWAELETYGYDLLDNAHDTLLRMKLEDYDFYVRDGEIILHFRKYLMTAGVAGAQNVPTGLYIGGNNAPTSEADTLDAPSEATGKVTLGNEGPVSYDKVFLDRWDNKLNKMGHHNAIVDATYLVLSGNGAVDTINQDLYQIAENFVNTYPREEVEQYHYAFGMAFHFNHSALMDLTYNSNGIVSVNMSYFGFWGEDNTYSFSGYSNSCGYTYSLSTGERLTLAQLTGLSEEEMTDKLKLGIRQWMSEKKDSSILDDRKFTDDAKERIENAKPSDFGVYVSEDGQIWVTLNRIHLRNHDGSRGYWVTIEFPLDCYID